MITTTPLLVLHLNLVTLRAEIVYKTNFRNFRQFLPNSRNQILAKNPPTGSHSVKLNPRQKKCFFPFLELANFMINDVPVKNILKGYQTI